MIISIQESLSQIRQQIVSHRLYSLIKTPQHLRIFMENHVFAVWDFMSLLKSLQKELTGVNLPWLPPQDAAVSRLINEIVLVEESDEHPHGGYASHFDLYQQAMQQAGANTQPILQLFEHLKNHQDFQQCLAKLSVHPHTKVFLENTFAIVFHGEIHEKAAAFCFGREEIIPAMFRQVVDELYNHFPNQFEFFKIYLERHMDVDENHHTPLAKRLITSLCGSDKKKWQDVELISQQCLQARYVLWDGIAAQIESL